MEKLKMQSKNLVEENIEFLARKFPNCVTEVVEDGKPVKKVDFDLLRGELSGVLVEGKDERYRLDWSGKRQAILTANSPIAKTLRPCREESVNFDTTENLYIEGDNLDVLKLLHETYLGKVKMIYIDPPYNTGNDFVYNDNFAEDADEYLIKSNQKDDQGNRMETNKDTSGRFHSDWLSMMYMRLKLAKDLLTDDGVILISIDDNEIGNLRKIADEIFSEGNLLAQAIWDLGTGTTAGHFTRSHEYIVVYAKDKGQLPNFDAIEDDNIVHGALKKISRANPASEITFPIGFPFEGTNATFKGVLGGSEQQFILSEKMEFKNGQLVAPTTIKAGWGMANQVRDWIAGKETYDSKGQKVVRFYFNKQGILFYEKERGTYNPKTVLSNIANTKNGSSEVIDLFGAKFFDFPKPTALIKYLALIVTRKDDTILDFFSGSATTAHAVMQLNAEDGGIRKFIMIQIPEEMAKDSEAYKAGYKTLCDIGKERIRRAGQKIAEENRMTAPNLDIGFRILKLDDSNMKEVYYNPKAYTQDMLLALDISIKDDRTAEDILFQVMLDKGVSLSSKIEKRTTANGQQTYYIVGETGFGIIDLICCLDKKINTDAVKEIAKLSPECCVFLDSGIANDATRTNVEQLFATYSPKTKVEVL